ncbi:phosphoenolpyruvate carboxylase [Coraliomargarita parva]|uniref:phosphoenolpyruvate carboxylase n=1 Tax=Coraliomargarita parva TaxID=3014050 RepID=UPI0022B4852C|nr:phosphoenolpyruvate carboxylase [Coraliomargarita parva]
MSETPAALKSEAKSATELNRGFEKIDADVSYLMNELKRVMEDSGHADMTDYLPWTGTKLAQREQFNSRMVQAYSIAFQLLSMVEENTANQIRRIHEHEGDLHKWRGLWGSHLKELKDEGLTEEEIANALNEVYVEPVLTAHPTESKRITVLELHRELYVKLVMRENSMWTPSEIEDIRRSIRTILDRLWRTGEIYLTKPSIEMERQGIEHYLTSIFPTAIQSLDRNLIHAWESLGFNPASLEKRRPHIRFGSWVGGDRDGHPFVTPQVTEESLLSYRIKALKLHKKTLIELRSKLSLSSTLQTPPEELLDGIAKQWEIIGSRAAKICTRNENEPWRQFVSFMIARIPVTEGVDSEVDQLSTDHFISYKRSTELRQDLELLRRSLLKVNAVSIVEEDIDPAINQVRTFGFHLASVDIRQNSAVHERAVSQILECLSFPETDYHNWDETKRVDFLKSQLNSPERRLRQNAKLGEDAQKVIGALAVVARHVKRYGTTALGALIVSMTRTVSDLMAVYLLSREAGLLQVDKDDNVICPLPVVPLLETVQDLENGPGILDEFLQLPITRNSQRWISDYCKRRDLVQQVMIGYSDSNKDKGILASQWALHKGQENIVAMGQQHGFRIRFFHGRGGTISRGAGPTDRFLEALPEGALSYDLRTTEQGEVIAQKFANLRTATYNLELLAAGTLLFSQPHKQTKYDEATATTLQALSDYSAETYQALQRGEDFMTFFRQATPIDVLEVSRIGSRPSRRTGAHTLDDLRAIPWVFSWSLSRYFLPGWYGVGSSLDKLCKTDADAYQNLKDGIHNNAFLRYVFTNVEASLISVDRKVMSAFSNLVEDDTLRSRFMEPINQDMELAHKHLQHLFVAPIEERRPNLVNTTQRRNKALEGLHFYQIELIKEWRSNGSVKEDETTLNRLLLTVNAIASGLKMTG